MQGPNFIDIKTKISDLVKEVDGSKGVNFTLITNKNKEIIKVKTFESSFLGAVKQFFYELSHKTQTNEIIYSGTRGKTVYSQKKIEAFKNQITLLSEDIKKEIGKINSTLTINQEGKIADEKQISNYLTKCKTDIDQLKLDISTNSLALGRFTNVGIIERKDLDNLNLTQNILENLSKEVNEAMDKFTEAQSILNPRIVQQFVNNIEKFINQLPSSAKPSQTLNQTLEDISQPVQIIIQNITLLDRTLNDAKQKFQEQNIKVDSKFNTYNLLPMLPDKLEIFIKAALINLDEAKDTLLFKNKQDILQTTNDLESIINMLEMFQENISPVFAPGIPILLKKLKHITDSLENYKQVLPVINAIEDFQNNLEINKDTPQLGFHNHILKGIIDIKNILTSSTPAQELKIMIENFKTVNKKENLTRGELAADLEDKSRVINYCKKYLESLGETTLTNLNLNHSVQELENLSSNLSAQAILLNIPGINDSILKENWKTTTELKKAVIKYINEFIDRTLTAPASSPAELYERKNLINLYQQEIIKIQPQLDKLNINLNFSEMQTKFKQFEDNLEFLHIALNGLKKIIPSTLNNIPTFSIEEFTVPPNFEQSSGYQICQEEALKFANQRMAALYKTLPQEETAQTSITKLQTLFSIEASLQANPLLNKYLSIFENNLKKEMEQIADYLLNETLNEDIQVNKDSLPKYLESLATIFKGSEIIQDKTLLKINDQILNCLTLNNYIESLDEIRVESVAGKLKNINESIKKEMPEKFLKIFTKKINQKINNLVDKVIADSPKTQEDIKEKAETFAEISASLKSFNLETNQKTDLLDQEVKRLNDLNLYIETLDSQFAKIPTLKSARELGLYLKNIAETLVSQNTVLQGYPEVSPIISIKLYNGINDSFNLIEKLTQQFITQDKSQDVAGIKKSVDSLRMLIEGLHTLRKNLPPQEELISQLDNILTQGATWQRALLGKLQEQLKNNEIDKNNLQEKLNELVKKRTLLEASSHLKEKQKNEEMQKLPEVNYNEIRALKIDQLEAKISSLQVQQNVEFPVTPPIPISFSQISEESINKAYRQLILILSENDRLEEFLDKPINEKGITLISGQLEKEKSLNDVIGFFKDLGLKDLLNYINSNDPEEMKKTLLEIFKAHNSRENLLSTGMTLDQINDPSQLADIKIKTEQELKNASSAPEQLLSTFAQWATIFGNRETSTQALINNVTGDEAKKRKALDCARLLDTINKDKEKTAQYYTVTLVTIQQQILELQEKQGNLTLQIKEQTNLLKAKKQVEEFESIEKEIQSINEQLANLQQEEINLNENLQKAQGREQLIKEEEISLAQMDVLLANNK